MQIYSKSADDENHQFIVINIEILLTKYLSFDKAFFITYAGESVL